MSGQTGQRINVTVIDFHPSRDTSICAVLAYVFDSTTQDNSTVCKSDERNHHMHLSESNSIQIQIPPAPSDPHEHEAFLVYYEGSVAFT